MRDRKTPTIFNLRDYYQTLADVLAHEKARKRNCDIDLCWLFKSSVRHFLATGEHLVANALFPGTVEIDLGHRLSVEIGLIVGAPWISPKKTVEETVSRRRLDSPVHPDVAYKAGVEVERPSGYADALALARSIRAAALAPLVEVLTAPDIGDGWSWRYASPQARGEDRLAGYEYPYESGSRAAGRNMGQDAGSHKYRVYLCDPHGVDVLAFDFESSERFPGSVSTAFLSFFARDQATVESQDEVMKLGGRDFGSGSGRHLSSSMSWLPLSLVRACARAVGVLVPRLLTHGDATRTVADGEHRTAKGACEIANGVAVSVSLGDGKTAYFKDGRLHRDGGPAIDHPYRKVWYRDGLLHRDDGPAIVTVGVCEWYEGGLRHRMDGPAVIEAYGKGNDIEREEWFVLGLRHNADGGPAVRDRVGVEWFSHGRRHRDGGPACIALSGRAYPLSPRKVQFWSHGRLHRVDGPARIDATGEFWYRHGKLHRAGGPAVIRPFGAMVWYRLGGPSRPDGGPTAIGGQFLAALSPDGPDSPGRGVINRGRAKASGLFDPFSSVGFGRSREETEQVFMWLEGGKLHRDQGPAIVREHGRQQWYRHGLPHREGGPANITPGRELSWYVDGMLHRADGPAVENTGDGKWYLNGVLHREDGPAVETRDREEWFRQGQRHRIDGPAVVRKNHAMVFYRDGVIHRDDGPASVWPDGTEVWYQDGLESRGGDLPALISKDGAMAWKTAGKKNRADGPALVTGSGDRYWYKDDVLHREDGPAVMRADGTLEWFRDGKLNNPDGLLISYPDGLEIRSETIHEPVKTETALAPWLSPDHKPGHGTEIGEGYFLPGRQAEAPASGAEADFDDFAAFDFGPMAQDQGELPQ
jgi:hypothetical protein